MSHPDLNKYERAALIGWRANEIAQGAPILIALSGETDAVVIAEKEFFAGKLNSVEIIRNQPGNRPPVAMKVSQLRTSFVLHYSANCGISSRG